MTEPTGDDTLSPEPTAPDPAAADVGPAVAPEASATEPAVPGTEPTAAPAENVARGLLFALAAIPAGVLVWVVIWQLGFIAAIVAFGVVAAAAWLYRRGSGGRIGGAGIAIIVAITLVTLVISFLAGIASDLAVFLELDFPAALGDALFWDTYWYNVFENPELWGEYAWSIVMSVVFAALGAFGVIRQLSREARAA